MCIFGDIYSMQRLDKIDMTIRVCPMTLFSMWRIEANPLSFVQIDTLLHLKCQRETWKFPSVYQREETRK